MKKSIVMFLVTLCLFFCSGCQYLTGGGVQEVPPAPDVLVTVGELIPGKTFGEIPVTVNINGEPVECTVEWIYYEDDGYGYCTESDVVPESFWGRADVYYYLPAGTDTTEIPISIDAPGGTYDGTGDVGEGPNGELHAWTHIQYDKSELVPDVHITVGTITAGKTFGSIPITVTVDGKEVDFEPVWIQYLEDDYSEPSANDKIPEGYWGRLDLYYFLPVGADPGNINLTLDAPGGTYDGTGEGAHAEDGAIEGWSHIQYDFRKNAEPKQEAHTHNWKIDTGKSKPVQCIVDGWDFYYCTGCNETKKETIQSLGHVWNVNSPTITQQASCTAPGTKVIYCYKCDESYRDTIPANGHKWGSPVITNGTSCTSPGTKTSTCSVCGVSQTETLPATGHSWGSFFWDNRETHSRSCTKCGAADKQPHNFDSNYYCPTCGYAIVN